MEQSFTLPLGISLEPPLSYCKGVFTKLTPVSMIAPFLESERIQLRPFTREDVPFWFQWFNDKATTTKMNKGAFPNTELAQDQFLETISRSKNDIQLAIASKKDHELIGAIGLHKIDWIHRHADISIIIGNKKYWGQGIATEAIGAMVEHAFAKLNLHKLTAGTWANNTGSQKAFEKNGFVLEGTLRDQFFFQDGYVDQICLGLLYENWKKTKEIHHV